MNQVHVDALRCSKSRLTGQGKLAERDWCDQFDPSHSAFTGRAERFVSRFAYVLGVAALRQRFVRGSHHGLGEAVHLC